MAMRTDREHLIALNLVPELGSARLTKLLQSFGSPATLCAAPVEALERAGVKADAARRLAAACHDDASPSRELALAQRSGVRIVTQADSGYPGVLRTIADPPAALYLRGVDEPLDAAPAVAIVGSRRASPYGMQCAEQLAFELALRGITVVSGLARGIDGAAHRGALKAGGRTAAVLGCGLSQIYPPEHAGLANEVAASGWLVSEFPMETLPLTFNFPRRNRLISGLSLGVVVVEAAFRSGALITADLALEQGREVFAVPGPVTAVTSRGTHELLKQGARLVTSVEDILDELRLTAAETPLAAAARSNGPAPELLEAERRIMACLGAEPRDIDTIAQASGMRASDASSLLLQLELKRVVRQLPGKQFVRHP